MQTEATSSEERKKDSPSPPTPEAFAELTKKQMRAEMKRLGITAGKRTKKSALAGIYREWYGASVTPEKPSERPQASAKSEPPQASAESEPSQASAESEPPQASVDDERRSKPRRKINVEIGLQTETNFFVGFSGDISEGGIFVTTVTLLPVGTAVMLSFSFPGGIEVEAEGQVAWTREGAAFDSDLLTGMGIRFTQLNDAALAAIQEFVSIREPIFYDD
jgi:uncharacterized protein (TIGR02266 family)